MKSAWTKWKSFAKKAAGIQATILLGIIYIVVMLPIAFIRKVSAKKTAGSVKDSSYWIDRAEIKQDLTWARRQ